MADLFSRPTYKRFPGEVKDFLTKTVPRKIREKADDWGDETSLTNEGRVWKAARKNDTSDAGILDSQTKANYLRNDRRLEGGGITMGELNMKEAHRKKVDADAISEELRKRKKPKDPEDPCTDMPNAMGCKGRG